MKHYRYFYVPIITHTHTHTHTHTERERERAPRERKRERGADVMPVACLPIPPYTEREGRVAKFSSIDYPVFNLSLVNSGPSCVCCVLFIVSLFIDAHTGLW